MNEIIKNSILRGDCVIFLGAGASYSSLNNHNRNIPTGGELKEILANAASIQLDDEDTLSDVYSAALKSMGNERLNRLLDDNFRCAIPSNEYKILANYPFSRVYTLNIDDAFEKAAYSINRKNFKALGRNDNIEDFDKFYSSMNLIKLNGDVNNFSQGLIFSSEEYGEGSAYEPLWYQELARDFHKYTFIFIGTKLNESLFNHQIKRYQSYTKSQNGKSFLISPKFSQAQREKFSNSNIECITGTLNDFVQWLDHEFPNGVKPRDILKYNGIDLFNNDDQDKLILFNGVTPVSRSSISLKEKKYDHEVKDFYKGYKPSWDDILRGVPAELGNTKEFLSKIMANSDERLFILLGSAGTGKTTSIKQIALLLSEKQDKNVYFIDGSYENLKGLIKELNTRNDRKYFLCIDRIANLATDIDDILSSSDGDKVLFIGTENLKIWNYRVEEHLIKYFPIIKEFETISNDDVDLILDKIKEYGNWTRLSKMTLKERRIELYKKSKKQLLIGLLEATSGEGFDKIIKKDYENIINNEEKMLLIISGIASMHRSEASIDIASRVLSYLHIDKNIYNIIDNMVGIIRNENGYLTTRHRVYFERLVSRVINKELMISVVTAYIKAYSVYKFPIVMNISKKDALIYKGIVNFKFLSKILNDNKDDVLNIYKSYEKILEQEGLFLLQYGLALRAFNIHDDALSKLIQAREAYPDSAHIEHAYAHQLLILSELASRDSNDAAAMDYLNKAITVLDRLTQVNKKLSDSYPLITLSVSHVRILNNLNKKDEAQKKARDYFNKLNNTFPDLSKNENSVINKTKRFLITYYSKGELIPIELNNYEYDN
ncbi:SIR2 family protein [Bisgaard Taxon 10/6]|uniref:P-loop NTPase n=1 Tax=Exercitatus varius TaxID=67857 RepID=UPI00294B6770|nr:SIR2 family protein [Exercitatus varius]MDG2960535.1 SIR2 family protein [Exercitatus varius]